MTCQQCKKIFNYDKYYGICPKCGKYNSKQAIIEEENIYERNGYDFNEMNHDHDELNQGVFKEETNTEQKNIQFKSNTLNLDLNPENLKKDLELAKELIQKRTGNLPNDDNNYSNNKKLTPEQIKQQQKVGKIVLIILGIIFFSGPILSFIFSIILAILTLIGTFLF